MRLSESLKLLFIKLKKSSWNLSTCRVLALRDLSLFHPKPKLNDTDPLLCREVTGLLLRKVAFDLYGYNVPNLYQVSLYPIMIATIYVEFSLLSIFDPKGVLWGTWVTQTLEDPISVVSGLTCKKVFLFSSNCFEIYMICTGCFKCPL